MNKLNKIVFISFASIILTACGGGGGGSDEPSKPTQPAGMRATAVANPVALTVKRPMSSRSAVSLKAAKVEARDDGDVAIIDPAVGLYATDEGGKEFRIHFTLTENGQSTSYDQKVEPKSAIQVSDDTVYLELFVATSTNGAIEPRQYLVQFSTGKMIEVQRLALADAFLNQAFKYVLPANSLHNGTNYPIVLLGDGKWYQLDPDWESLTVAKELLSGYVSTYGSQGPAGNILFTADKQEYRAEHGAVGADNNYITHNNQVLYKGNSGLWLADDGRVVVSNNGGLFYVVEKDGRETLEQFSDYVHEQTGNVWPLTTIWVKSGDYYLGTNCQVNRDNGGVLEMPFFNSWDTDSYHSAGAQSMVCVDKPYTTGLDMLNPEDYCAAGLEWRMWSLSVDGGAKREITALNAEPFQITQLSEDTAYVMLSECVQQNGKWTNTWSHNIVNFADNSVTKVNDFISLSAFIH